MMSLMVPVISPSPTTTFSLRRNFGLNKTKPPPSVKVFSDSAVTLFNKALNFNALVPQTVIKAHIVFIKQIFHWGIGRINCGESVNHTVINKVVDNTSKRFRRVTDSNVIYNQEISVLCRIPCKIKFTAGFACNFGGNFGVVKLIEFTLPVVEVKEINCIILWKLPALNASNKVANQVFIRYGTSCCGFSCSRTFRIKINGANSLPGEHAVKSLNIFINLLENKGLGFPCRVTGNRHFCIFKRNICLGNSTTFSGFTVHGDVEG